MSRGFAPIVLIFGFVILLGGIVGGAYYLKSQGYSIPENSSVDSVPVTSTVTASPSPAVTSAQNELEIKELGIKFPLGKTKDWEYKIDPNGAATFSTKSIEAFGKTTNSECLASGPALGWVIVLNKPADQEAPIDFIGQIGNKYLYYSDYANPCDEATDVVKKKSDAKKELREQLKMAKLL